MIKKSHRMMDSNHYFPQRNCVISILNAYGRTNLSKARTITALHLFILCACTENCKCGHCQRRNSLRPSMSNHPRGGVPHCGTESKKDDMSKHVVFFGTPDWIRTSGLQSRSYQVVKAKTLDLQGFHWYCTILRRITRNA